VSPEAQNKRNLAGIIAGSVGAVLAIIAITVAGIILYKRKNNGLIGSEKLNPENEIEYSRDPKILITQENPLTDRGGAGERSDAWGGPSE
jgi:hypothetical protein